MTLNRRHFLVAAAAAGHRLPGWPGLTVEAGPVDMILARYSNGRVAAGFFGFGRGAVGVRGPHPEAPLSWYTDADLDVPSPMPHQAFIDLVTTTLARRR